jgi:hypothetical protein
VSRRAAIILSAILAIILIGMFVGTWVLLREVRVSQTHLIPDGYTGWVSVEYGVKEAPPLPVEDGRLVFRYDDQGELETSTEFVEGWALDGYYYVAGETRRPLRQGLPGFHGRIWGNHTRSQMVTQVDGRTVRTGVSTGFFVGTEEQYKTAQQQWREDLLHGIPHPPEIGRDP